MQNSVSTRRQLAAIMFTDIAGYTAMMQSDETRAMRMLAHYRSVLQQAVTHHGGELLQHIGDGSLTMFQSAVQAVACAIDLQRSLSAEPQVGVRAGIHLGDVVIEPDSIYGDGVNIASRIEQLADPGSVLITQTVYDSIRNQRKFRVKYLGTPRLKNVMAPLRVYAIRNPGIAVPERLTKHVSFDTRSLRQIGAGLLTLLILGFIVFATTLVFGSKKGKTVNAILPELVIAPMKNHTGDPGLEEIGALAIAHLGRAIQDKRLAQVKPLEAVKSRHYYMLRGSYYQAHGVIVFQCRMEDGRTGNILSVFDPEVSPLTDPVSCLDALTEQVMGFWTTQQLPGTPSPKAPRYSAYAEFAKGRQVFYREPDEAVSAFSTAAAMDPSYVAPRLALMHRYYLDGDAQALHAQLKSISASPDLSSAENRILLHWELVLKSEYQRAFDTLSTLLETPADDAFVRMQLAHLALEYLRRPRTALSILEPLIRDEKLSVDDAWAAWMLYQQNLLKVNRYRQLIDDTWARLNETAHPMVLQDLTRAYCRIEQHAELRALFDDCRQKRLLFPCRAHRIAYWAAVEYFLIGDTLSMMQYVSQGLGLPQESRAGEAALHYLGRHYHTAAAMYREVAETAADHASRLDLRTRAAIALWYSGDTTAIDTHLHTLDSVDAKLSLAYVQYQKGRLAAAAGDKETALAWLERSALSGIPHRYGYFETDIFLAPLFRENRFLRLTEAQD